MRRQSTRWKARLAGGRRPLVLTLLVAALAMAFAVLLPGVAHAEGEQVLGTLSTSRSGPIPDVRITVTDADGEEVGQVQTDDRGPWSVDLPGEGQYEVTLDAGDLPDDVTLGSGGDSRTVTVGAGPRAAGQLRPLRRHDRQRRRAEPGGSSSSSSTGSASGC